MATIELIPKEDAEPAKVSSGGDSEVVVVVLVPLVLEVPVLPGLAGSVVVG